MLNYQRVVAEINLDNIAYNISQIQNFKNKDTKLMAVVKADAYGHGALEISKIALYNGADYLGVAICDEALLLRNSNILSPILILGYTIDCQIEEVIKNDITQTIFSYEMAEKFSNLAVKLNKNIKIHIKIDTGMGRLGFLPVKSSISDICKIKNLPNLTIEGIFTHFSTSDFYEKTYTIEQYNKFINFCNNLEKNGVSNLIKHTCNSAGILNFPEYHLDMVRAGIIIYGLYPSKYTEKIINLKPAMSLKTHISYIKNIEKNTAISYGRTFISNKNMKVATVPVGYADGYSRIMSNAIKVIANDTYCDVIGAICMDQFIIDINHLDDAKVFDEIILIGQSKNCKITAEDLANLQNTINYEIVCNVGKRVPRVYIKSNEVLKTINYNF